MYNHETPMPFGKYKFTALCRLPANYLLNIYNNSKNLDKDLTDYIRDNLEQIKAKLNKPNEQFIVMPICEKKSYLSKKDAKQALRKITQIEQEEKKPIRVYECEKCSQWHLTSMELEEFKEIITK